MAAKLQISWPSGINFLQLLSPPPSAIPYASCVRKGFTVVSGLTQHPAGQPVR